MEITKALVVDDSRSARFSLRKTLEKLGIHTDCVESGETALSYLTESEHQLPDVIFMDNLMPGMDGYTTSKTIQDHTAWTQIPIIMCSATENKESLPKILEHGMVGILPKPASASDISAMLSNLSEDQSGKALETANIYKNKLSGSEHAIGDWDSLPISLQEALNNKIVQVKMSLQDLIEKKLAHAIKNNNVSPSGSLEPSGTLEELPGGLDSKLNQMIQDEMEAFKSQIRQELNSKSLTEKDILEKAKEKSSFIATHQAIETSQSVARETALKIISKELKQQSVETKKTIELNNEEQLKAALNTYKAISFSAIGIAILSFIISIF